MRRWSVCATRRVSREFVDDCNNGHKRLLEQREAIDTHPIETTGAQIRSMFSWIKKED